MERTYKRIQVLNRLPESLHSLEKIAKNLWWCWNYDAIDLFQNIDIDLWGKTNHSPLKLLSQISPEQIQKLSEDAGFLNKLKGVYNQMTSYLEAPNWFAQNGKNNTCIAYFSAEFGIHESFPNYSGGLGVLAGDHLKSASDVGLPLYGVGLLYRRGYFRQYMNEDGWQQEDYPYLDFYQLPLEFVKKDDGELLLVDIDLPSRKVYARVAKVNVGRVSLFLLDTDITANEQTDREITDVLYGGDAEHRICQELVLGVGGIRALKMMGIYPTVVHMNEGHSAFSALERIRAGMAEEGLSYNEARELVKGSTIFTTHTPVPAGNEVFPDDLIARYLEPYFTIFQLPLEQFLDLGRIHQGRREENFGMTVFSLKMAAAANGVSALHGRVSQEMWHKIWINLESREAPIGHVTNGIHLPSWISDEMERLYNRYVSPEWMVKADDTAIWTGVKSIPAVELWKARQRLRARLVSFVRMYQKSILEKEKHSPIKIAEAENLLDSDALTIGFARRFATYKRAYLLLRDKERLLRLLRDPSRPLQFVFAGKAHPRDMEGKKLIKEIIHFARENNISERFVFLENYDIHIARYLVQGVDIWLNTPRRPHEASGTSGMKVPANGGLNCSILDGWWAEGYVGGNGWAIGRGEEYHDYAYQDYVESRALYDLLESDVIPAFYERGADGLPHRWIDMIRNSIKDLVPVFHTDRMVKEYNEKYYMPLSQNYHRLIKNKFSLLKEYSTWKENTQSKFASVKVLEFFHEPKGSILRKDTVKFIANIDTADLKETDIEVILILNLSSEEETQQTEKPMLFQKREKNAAIFEAQIEMPNVGLNRYAIRVNPSHEAMFRKLEPGLILWG